MAGQQYVERQQTHSTNTHINIDEPIYYANQFLWSCHETTVSKGKQSEEQTAKCIKSVFLDPDKFFSTLFTRSSNEKWSFFTVTKIVLIVY